MEKPEIKFWFDEFERKIMIVHIPSGRKRELKRDLIYLLFFPIKINPPALLCFSSIFLEV